MRLISSANSGVGVDHWLGQDVQRGGAQAASFGGGLAAALSSGAHVVVRIHYMTMPLETSEGQTLNTLALLETLDSHEIGDWPVFMRHGKRRFALRLVTVKKRFIRENWGVDSDNGSAAIFWY